MILKQSNWLKIRYNRLMEYYLMEVWSLVCSIISLLLDFWWNFIFSYHKWQFYASINCFYLVVTLEFLFAVFFLQLRQHVYIVFIYYFIIFWNYIIYYFIYYVFIYIFHIIFRIFHFFFHLIIFSYHIVHWNKFIMINIQVY